VQKFLKEHPELHHWSPIILVERNLGLWAELKEPMLLVRNRCRPYPEKAGTRYETNRQNSA
jgi:hypothetical protein